MMPDRTGAQAMTASGPEPVLESLFANHQPRQEIATVEVERVGDVFGIFARDQTLELPYSRRLVIGEERKGGSRCSQHGESD